MLKSVKVNLVLLLTVVCASISGVNAQIQAPAQNVATDVSEQELSNFADAYQAIQVENQKIQEKMESMIQESGLDVEKFQKIQNSKMNPEAEVEATEEELTAHQTVMTKIQAMQPELQTQMETVIKNKGLSIERYQEVASAIQADASLQQKLQAIIMKQQTGGSEG